MERLNYYNPDIEFDRKALTEVWTILNDFDEELDKIPEKYLWVIEDNMDREYEFDIDGCDATVLMDDTKRIITYLYTNFLSEGAEHKYLKTLENIQYIISVERKH